jgi:Rhs element Vgr protein
METVLNQTLVDLLHANYTSQSRLYTFKVRDSEDLSAWLEGDELLVAAFASRDQLHGIAETDVLVLARQLDLPLTKLVGRIGQFEISLANGQRSKLHGIITQADTLGSDGGLVRYQLRLSSWLSLLTHTAQSRVWQEQTIEQIINSVLTDYSPHAHWQWSDDAYAVLQTLPVRSYCIQYRETPFAFISRLLAEDGLSWRTEQDHPDAPDGHSLILFADSREITACEDNPDQASTGSLPYTGTGAQHETDSLLQLSTASTLPPNRMTLTSYDYKAKASSSASLPSQVTLGSHYYAQLPPVEQYDTPGQYAFTDNSEAERHANLRMQAVEVRHLYWQGLSTVRSLRAGQRFNVADNPRYNQNDANSNNTDADSQHTARLGSGKLDTDLNSFITSQVLQIGINNIPYTQGNDAKSLGSISTWLQQHIVKQSTSRNADPLTVTSPNTDKLLNTTQQLGYANAFTAILGSQAWRPQLSQSTSIQHLNAKPTAFGSQTARVVGFSQRNDADDNSPQAGSSEICCDKLGRVRIRFQWQDAMDEISDASNNASCWVRVAQRSAGGGMGMQFLPRIGQEVQVQFIEGDIDRPIILGALYHGQGEGGIKATPDAAENNSTNNTSSFALASDHTPSAQGNLAGGHAPVWHGASPDGTGHNNPAAQWGIRSQEFAGAAYANQTTGSGAGYNQLVFDDSDTQGRIQLKTTQAGTALNLGHLIHTADNHRGNYRGQGIELRTDAWGALRAGAGWHLSSYGITHNVNQRSPAAHSPASYGLLNSANTLSQTLSQLAANHLSVPLAAQLGSSKANQSHLRDQYAPIKALAKVTQGMVTHTSVDQAYSDAAQHNTQTGQDKLPQHTNPIISLIAKDDLSYTAAQSLQLNSSETINLINAGHSQHTTGGQMRIHTGQAIGLTTGGLKAGTGLQLIAAQGDTSLQAHDDQIAIKAQQQLDIKSAHSFIDLAAAKHITLRTAGGASITIQGGNITVQCPGKLTVHAGSKGFAGPVSMNALLPIFPKAICLDCLLRALKSGAALAVA